MKISMIISTFNRGHLLGHSLERLSRLTLPYEVIVVDDGGADDTAQVCDQWGDYMPITYVYNDNPGSTICSLGRNIGIKLARSEWIVTSEPELIYRTDVLAQFMELHPEHPHEVISCGRVYFAPDGWVGDVPPGCQEAIGWVSPHTALWKKNWLVEVGGWDEEFPGAWGFDDTDLLTRLRIKGHGQYIAPEVEAIHQFHGYGADAGSQNEQHWLAKSFHGDESPNNDDVVANRGIEWGRIRSR